MGVTLFGVPAWMVGCGALAAAVVFAFKRTRGLGPIVEWAHSGVWALIAAAAFLSWFGQAAAARIVAIGALVLYGFFIYTLVRQRGGR